MRKGLLSILTAALCLAGCTIERIEPGRGATIEVAVFEGGYGIDWHRGVARDYERLRPGIRVNLWGDPRVDEKLKPRILRGDPPELANATLPAWKLITAGKLYPLDAALDGPAYGSDKSWRSTLVPGVLSDWQYRGHTYAMPTNLSAWVCWYDKRMFRAHGWQPPQTWGELVRLCDRIKAAGIAPLAFQGKYPSYAWFTLLSIYQRLVPLERWYRMEDIRPGAFTDPEFIHAARLLQQLAVNYFEPGALAMSHTESQLEWVNGRAAMVFCGLWLEHEMANAIPPGFEMACFRVPAVEGGSGDPRAIYAGGAENFMVFAEAKHPALGLDFLRYMTSLPCARTYVMQLETLSPVKGSTDGVEVTPGLRSAVAIVNASDRIFSDRLTGLYLEWNDTVVHDALADLVAGRTTPEAFGRRLEAGMEAVRENPDIYKPPPRGVPAG